MIYDVTDMSQYLRGYGKALADRIRDQAEPLYSPGDEWDDRLHGLLKKPYQAQGDAVMAISKLLDTSDSAMLVGEMGCGKTLMGLAIPYVHNRPEKPPRTLVMCPGHLVGKWQREAKETIPDGEGRIIRGLGDVLPLSYDDPRDKPLYYIVSKDRAKLGYAWKPSVVERRGVYCCPRCYDTVTDADDVPVDYEYLKRNRRECGGCGTSLWQADNERIRRFPVSEYVRQHLKGYFDYLIADEVHELKGGDTAQGNSFGGLASACGKSIALTGTLLGGYADDVFYVLYRLAPGSMKDDGLDYGQVGQWMARYGVLERITKRQPGEDNVFSKGRKGSTRVKRKPGVSPAVFSKHLLGETVFVGLQDMTADLPPITEHVDGVKMDPELAEAYGALEGELLSEVRAALARGDKSLLGSYVNALLSYPDRPFDNEPIIHPGTGEVVVTPLELPRDYVYAKERKLIDLMRSNLREGRRTCVYIVYSGTKDVGARLHDLLSEEGIDAPVLRASVAPEKREEWVKRKVDDGAAGMIANSRLLATGVDLFSHPTICFFQTGYSVYTLRQASRRAWRIGQRADCRVEYLHYDSTLQQRAMQLMGSKLRASLAIEGRYSDEGLLAMTQGEDMTSALAKALVDGLEGEGVEEMWAKLNTTTRDETLPGPYTGGLLLHVDPTGSTRKKRATRRKPKVAGAEQLSLFADG